MTRTPTRLAFLLLGISACGGKPGGPAPWGEDSGATPVADCTSEPFETVTGPGGIEMIHIPPGVFMMGSPEDELGRNPIYEVLHQVTITRAMLVGRTEVTQEQFEAVMGYDPSLICDALDCPVEVAFNEAAAFANHWSVAEGLTECYDCPRPPTADDRYQPCDRYPRTPSCDGYRMPTAAEHQYYTRAGTTTAFPNGGELVDEAQGESCEAGQVLSNGALLDDDSWYCGNSGEVPQLVGTLLPNDWGLHDLTGNVFELTSDTDNYDSTDPVVDPNPQSLWPAAIAAGGAVINGPSEHRSASLGGGFPDVGIDLYEIPLGFRLVRTCASTLDDQR
jgi:formylglycine-generating enzyme required for sulfatase activity